LADLQTGRLTKNVAVRVEQGKAPLRQGRQAEGLGRWNPEFRVSHFRETRPEPDKRGIFASYKCVRGRALSREKYSLTKVGGVKLRLTKLDYGD